MSCVGTMIGLRLAGERMLLVDIIKPRASTCASTDSGTCTAIWSPSKSALYAAQTSGWSWMALPSISTGSKAWMPRRGGVGARVRGPGGSRMTPSRGCQAAERRRAVQEHRVLADDLFQDVPDLGTLLLHHLLRRLDGVDVPALFE